MTGPAAPGPARPEAPDDAEVQLRLARAVSTVDAPDVVFAVSRRGRRTTACGGTGRRDGSGSTAQPAPREALRYELGSLSKTFTVLLLAELARAGVLALDDPLAAHLPGVRLPHPYARSLTLRHLATHTSGLPRVPRDLVAGALLRPYGNGYAGYGTDRLLHAFARTRLRHAPGSHWHYSNFGVALLGPAMAHATGTDYPALLAERVLRPLALTATTAAPDSAGQDTPGTAGTRHSADTEHAADSPRAAHSQLTPGTAGTRHTADSPRAAHSQLTPHSRRTADTERADATGYRGDGRTPLPPTDMAAFAPAGAVRATPADLLTYAEALLSPGTTPLTGALHDVQVPQLRRGVGRRHTHTLTWYRHPAPDGPLLFHAGATFGHQAFLGFHPSSGTAVAALSTRHDRTCRLVTCAYELLHELCAAPTATSGV